MMNIGAVEHSRGDDDDVGDVGDVDDTKDDVTLNVKKKNLYFDNTLVESLMNKYTERGCVDIHLRDEIMSHATELIRQTIRAHNFEYITPGRDQSSFNELFQVAWMQIEKTLYKYDSSPGSSKIFNMWCVAPDTILFSENGLIEINDIEHNKCRVNGGEGLNDVKEFIRRENVDTLVIKTENGYELECTPEHLLMQLSNDGRGWTKACDLKIDDLIGIQYNQNIFGDNNDVSDIILNKNGNWDISNIDEELSWIIGLFIAEGSYSYGKLVIYNIDDDVINLLVNNNLDLNFIHEPQYQRISLCNVRFIEFLTKLGFGDKTCALEKCIPNRLLKMSKNNISSMLSGMFDGDGHSRKLDGTIGYTSISNKLIKQIRMLLLNYGIITKISVDDRKIGDFRNGFYKKHLAYQILLSSKDSELFYKEIGFGINRKQRNKNNLKNIKDERYGIGYLFNGIKSAIRSLKNNDSLLKKSNIAVISREFLRLTRNNLSPNKEKLLLERINEFTSNRNNVIWLPIKSIEKSYNDVCEIEVDSESRSYISNGIISHNSQIAKTRILAYLKKEKRDKKNMPSFKDYTIRKYKTKSRSIEDFEIFIKELNQFFEYDNDLLGVVDAMKKIWAKDDKPYDAFKIKLKNESGHDMNVINGFLKIIRLHRDEFSINFFDNSNFEDDSNSSYYYNDHDE